MTITAAQVQHVATLARLRFDPGSSEKLAYELTSILQYVKILSKVQTEDVPPTSHALDPQSNVLRADLVSPGLSQAQALAPAPAATDGMFRVPRVVEV